MDFNRLRDQIRVQICVRLRDQIRVRLRDQFRDQLNNQPYAQLRVRLSRNQIGEQLLEDIHANGI